MHPSRGEFAQLRTNCRVARQHAVVRRKRRYRECFRKYLFLKKSRQRFRLICPFLVGEADLISLISNRVIHKYRFNDRVLHLSFSPDGKHIAACKLNKGKNCCSLKICHPVLPVALLGKQRKKCNFLRIHLQFLYCKRPVTLSGSSISLHWNECSATF